MVYLSHCTATMVARSHDSQLSIYHSSIHKFLAKPWNTTPYKMNALDELRFALSHSYVKRRKTSFPKLFQSLSIVFL